jgi:hypothetical protein
VQLPNSIGVSNVVLNGGTNVVHVGAGAQFSVSLEYVMEACGCSSCTDEIEIGLVPGNPQTCPYTGPEHCNNAVNGPYTGMLTAPNTPGVYDLRFNLRLDYSCLQTTQTWWNAQPGPDRTVGVVCVP